MLIDSRKLRFTTQYGATPHGINVEKFLAELPRYAPEISDIELEGLEPTNLLIRRLRVTQYREINYVCL